MADGDIHVSSNFDLSSQRPLDSRDVIDTLANRDLIPYIKRYDLMEVKVQENKHIYRLILGTEDEDLSNNLNWVDVTITPGVTNISIFNNDANYTSTGDNISIFTNDSNYTAQGDNISVFTNDSNYVASGENISVFVNDANYISSGDNVSSLVNDAGYLTSIPGTYLESGDNISLLTNDAGYLTSFSETDPIFLASDAAGITSTDIGEWNNAYTHSVIVTGNPHFIDYADTGAEQAFSKNTAFNKDFGGTGTATTVSRSDHWHANLVSQANITGQDSGACIAKRYQFTDSSTLDLILSYIIEANYSPALSPAAEGTALLTIPAGYRPLFNTGFRFYCYNGSSYFHMDVVAETGGNIVAGVGGSGGNSIEQLRGVYVTAR